MKTHLPRLPCLTLRKHRASLRSPGQQPVAARSTARRVLAFLHGPVAPVGGPTAGMKTASRCVAARKSGRVPYGNEKCHSAFGTGLQSSSRVPSAIALMILTVRDLDALPVDRAVAMAVAWAESRRSCCISGPNSSNCHAMFGTAARVHIRPVTHPQAPQVGYILPPVR